MFTPIISFLGEIINDRDNTFIHKKGDKIKSYKYISSSQNTKGIVHHINNYP